MFSRLLGTHITDFPGISIFDHRDLAIEILHFDFGTAWDTVPRFQSKGKGRLVPAGSDLADIGNVTGQSIGIARCVTIITADGSLEIRCQQLEGLLQVMPGNILMISQESLFGAIRLFIGQADADGGFFKYSSHLAQDSRFPVIGLKSIFVMDLGSVFRGLIVIAIGIDDIIERASLMDSPLALGCRRRRRQHDDFVVFDDDVHIGELMVNGPVLTVGGTEFPSQPVFGFIPALSQVNTV